MDGEIKKNVISILDNPEQTLKNILDGKADREKLIVMEDVYSGIALANLKFKEFEILASKEFNKITRNAGQKSGLKL